VAGLPDPRPDHAIVMAKFARDCINEHIAQTKELEVTLGPDTSALRLRVGLHSGPITAGEYYLVILTLRLYRRGFIRINRHHCVILCDFVC
jgi:class 3 adenylate cyclase